MQNNYAGVPGLEALMHRLRQECEWDKAQTHESLIKFLIEECFELVEAIETGNNADLQEELGDVLLQVVFHAEIAGFTLDDIANTVSTKMIKRHPEIFAGAPKKYKTLEEREKQWQQDKRAEKTERQGPFDGVPASLPALFQATKMIDRAKKLDVALPEAIQTPGGQLFALVEQMHAQGLDSEAELRTFLRQLRNQH